MSPAKAKARSSKKTDTRLARRERLVGDMLPYAKHLDDTTIVTRDGQQMQVLHLAGFAFETADTQELNYRKNVRDTVLRGVASSRLSIGAYVLRHMVHPDLTGGFANPFAKHLDDAWRERLA